LCRDLLAKDQEVPSISRFSKNGFTSTCQTIRMRNEAKVIQDITQLIVLWVKEVNNFSDEHLEYLIKSIIKGWNNSITITRAYL
ncbi:hypothetical protein P154DRAFT_438266, partial [Amniculicola lignicola CBS 123094]